MCTWSARVALSFLVALLVSGVGGCRKGTAPTAASSGSGGNQLAEQSQAGTGGELSAAGNSSTPIVADETARGGREQPPAAPTTEAAEPQHQENKKTSEETPPPARGDGDAPAVELQAPLDIDQWTKGIQDLQLLSMYQAARSHLTTTPHDARSKALVIYLLLRFGEEKESQERGGGQAHFLQAAKELRELLKWGGVDGLPEGFHQVLPFVFMREAGVYSRGGKLEEAKASLEEAARLGFQDLDALQKHEDFENLRKEADFETLVAKCRALVAEKLRSTVAQMIADFQSFPFDFHVTDVKGTPHQLADYKGKVLIVDIWGTWCPPCRAEIPSFIKLQETYAEQGFQMIGLNYEGEVSEEKAELVRQFIQEHGINYPCALATEEIRDQVPDFEAYPTTLFIDRNGKVRLKVVGLHSYEFLEAAVLRLLEEPNP